MEHKLESGNKRRQPASKKLQLAMKRLQPARKRCQPARKRLQPARKSLQPARKGLLSATRRLQPARKGLQPARKRFHLPGIISSQPRSNISLLGRNQGAGSRMHIVPSSFFHPLDYWLQRRRMKNLESTLCILVSPSLSSHLTSHTSHLTLRTSYLSLHNSHLIPLASLLMTPLVWNRV